MSDFGDRYSMSRYRQRQPAVQVVFGLVIAAMGVLFTLDNLNILRARDFFQFWPMVFVAIGLAQLAQARGAFGAEGQVPAMEAVERARLGDVGELGLLGDVGGEPPVGVRHAVGDRRGQVRPPDHR